MATVYQQLDPAAAQYLATNFPQAVKNGTNIPVFGLAYDAATSEAAFWCLSATNYGSGNITVDIYWYADTATSGDIIWRVQLAAITPNMDTQDTETKTLATANSATDTHLGTTGQRLHQIAVTVSNLDSIANADIFWVRIDRDAANASDTMTGDGILVWARVSYSDT